MSIREYTVQLTAAEAAWLADGEVRLQLDGNIFVTVQAPLAKQVKQQHKVGKTSAVRTKDDEGATKE